MNEAYAMWKTHKEWSIDEFFDHLSFIQRVAVALGNLNYQVGNGGFSQWGFNGYAESHYDFLSRLNTEKYPQLTEALKIMQKAYPFLSRKDEFFDDDEDSVVDSCDNEYYALKKLEEEMETFLTDLQKQ